MTATKRRHGNKWTAPSERDKRILIARLMAQAGKPLGLVEIAREAKVGDYSARAILLEMLNAKEAAQRAVAGLRSPKWIVTEKGRALAGQKLDRDGYRGGFDDSALAAVMAQMPVRSPFGPGVGA